MERMEKMKRQKILKYCLGLLGAILLFVIAFCWGWEYYKSGLIAVKHIDGKYGKAFYGVEVTGKDAGNRIEVYARIMIGGMNRFYCHNCGKIGIAKDWEEARTKFSDIRFDGKTLLKCYVTDIYHSYERFGEKISKRHFCLETVLLDVLEE